MTDWAKTTCSQCPLGIGEGESRSIIQPVRFEEDGSVTFGIPGYVCGRCKPHEWFTVPLDFSQPLPADGWRAMIAEQEIALLYIRRQFLKSGRQTLNCGGKTNERDYANRKKQ